MSNLNIPEGVIDDIIDLALAEDTSYGDITSQILIPDNQTARATIQAKEAGTIAGIEIALKVFLRVDPSLEVKLLVEDGSRVKSGDIIATVSGRAVSVLKAERTAINFLQRLSGIASLTARYVAETAGFKARIMDTRKTTPILRALEKYAVRMGGGTNHRLHLGDSILIKDNHLAAMRARGMSLKDIVLKAKGNAPQGITVEIEATSTVEALEAVAAGADIIMLDNMNPDEMKGTVDLVSGRARIEASGGITLDNVRQVAATGVDMISIGALTHSPKALDINLEFET